MGKTIDNFYISLIYNNNDEEWLSFSSEKARDNKFCEIKRDIDRSGSFVYKDECYNCSSIKKATKGGIC